MKQVSTLDVVNVGDGSYSVPFCTRRAGTYQMTVRVVAAGAAAKRRPSDAAAAEETLTCSLRIYAASMVPGLCVLDGAGVVHAVAGQPATVTVRGQARFQTNRTEEEKLTQVKSEAKLAPSG